MGCSLARCPTCSRRKTLFHDRPRPASRLRRSIITLRCAHLTPRRVLSRLCRRPASCTYRFDLPSALSALSMQFLPRVSSRPSNNHIWSSTRRNPASLIQALLLNAPRCPSAASVSCPRTLALRATRAPEKHVPLRFDLSRGQRACLPHAVAPHSIPYDVFVVG